MSFIKLITESFHDNLKNNQKEVIVESNFTVEDLDKLILESTNTLTSIKAKYEDLKNTWKSLKEDLQTFSFYSHINSEACIKEQFQKAINDLKIEYRDTKKTLDIYKEQKNKLLLEDTSKNEDAQEYEDLKSKYLPVFERVQEMLNTSNIDDTFDYIFKKLVPQYGKAETKAGEIIRALMRILYEFMKSDQALVFYEGEGKSLFGNAARFLKDNGYEDYLSEVVGLTGDSYEEAMKSVVEKVLRDFVSTQEDLFYTKNNIDYELITLKESSN